MFVIKSESRCQFQSRFSLCLSCFSFRYFDTHIHIHIHNTIYKSNEKSIQSFQTISHFFFTISPSAYIDILIGTVLLQNIIQRFTNSTDKSQQLRVFNIMKAWINCQYLDFRDDPSLKQSTLEFVPTMAAVVSEKQTQMLITMLEKKLSSLETEPKTYLIPKTKEWNLIKLDSGEIARQMTLYDRYRFYF
jgi:hypothetical protein